jgi:AcrR family transcriptional regulator
MRSVPKIVDHSQRRAEVLEATWRVVSRLGLEGTTTREIAREANCSTGVLAHYFKNKDEILRMALDYAHDRVRLRIIALEQRYKGVILLRAVLAELIPLDYQRQVQMTLEISFWGRAVANTGYRALQHNDVERWHARLRGLIEQSIAIGELPADLDPEESAAALVCFNDGLGLNAYLYPERYSAARVEALLDRELSLLGADLTSARRLVRHARPKATGAPGRKRSAANQTASQ